MSTRPSGISPWGVAGLYFLAAILIFWPLADLVTNTWPMQWGDFRWRYGFAGLLGGFHLTPLFGYVLAMYVAIWLRHAHVLRLVSVSGFAALLALGLVMVMFPLDTIQVRSGRPPEGLQALTAGAIIAEAKHFTTAVALLLLSVGSWGSANRIATGAAPASSRPGQPGVIIRPDPR